MKKIGYIFISILVTVQLFAYPVLAGCIGDDIECQRAPWGDLTLPKLVLLSIYYISPVFIALALVFIFIFIIQLFKHEKNK